MILVARVYCSVPALAQPFPIQVGDEGWTTLGKDDFVRVNGGKDRDASEGYLCLQSEGAPILLRNIRVRELT